MEGEGEEIKEKGEGDTGEEEVGEEQPTGILPPMHAVPEIYGQYVDPGWHQHHPEAHMMHSMHPMYGYQYPMQHMEGVPLPPGIPGLGGSTDPLEAVLGPFPCVRLRNLPYDGSLEDVLVFFQGLVLIDVILLGQGEAFVIFSNPMDHQMALQRQTIGRRFVDIKAASRSEYYEAVSQHQEREKGRSHSSGGVMSGSGMGGMRRDGRGEDHHGDSRLWGNEGLSHHPPHHHHEGHHGPSSYDSYHGSGMMMGGMRHGMGPSRGVLHTPLQRRTGGGIQVGDHTGYLRMRGLPFSASRDDIYKFFVGYNPIPDSIVLTYRSDGRATGEAYVGFASPNDSERAMELHRRSMGNRYIELFISNKDEQGRALARFGNR